jgi:riboflavin biosynthesis pyrimidine reductase
VRGVEPIGPGSPYTVLFDEGDTGADLASEFEPLYGRFRLPEPIGRPWVGINLVISRDGHVSFGEPGYLGGDAVSGYNRHDTWLMGLLRSRVDAILVGDMTLRVEPEHIWTPEYIFPEDGPAFAWLRATEGRRPDPLVVFISLDGALNMEATTLNRDDIEIVVATTDDGAVEAERRLRGRANCEILPFGAERVDTAALVRWLGETKGMRHVLAEGGPRVYGSVLADAVLDEEFVTLSPLMLGSISSAGDRRPSLVEGVGFAPGLTPYMAPISLRRAGDHLFLRSRVSYPYQFVPSGRPSS